MRNATPAAASINPIITSNFKTFMQDNLLCVGVAGYDYWKALSEVAVSNGRRFASVMYFQCYITKKVDLLKHAVLMDDNGVQRLVHKREVKRLEKERKAKELDDRIMRQRKILDPAFYEETMRKRAEKQAVKNKMKEVLDELDPCTLKLKENTMQALQDTQPNNPQGLTIKDIPPEFVKQARIKIREKTQRERLENAFDFSKPFEEAESAMCDNGKIGYKNKDGLWLSEEMYKKQLNLEYMNAKHIASAIKLENDIDRCRSNHEKDMRELFGKSAASTAASTAA